MIKFQSLPEASLCRKFGIAFVFMSLVPIILLLFLIYYFKVAPLLESQLPYLRLTLLMVVLLSLASFDLIRRSMTALHRFAKYATEIAGGAYHKRIDVKDKDEIGSIAESFNAITKKLQDRLE